MLNELPLIIQPKSAKKALYYKLKSQKYYFKKDLRKRLHFDIQFDYKKLKNLINLKDNNIVELYFLSLHVLFIQTNR